MIETKHARIENIMPATLREKNIVADVLRLDLLHPVISGNKWFKLQNYLDEAGKLNKEKILTWGGAWSNHLLATAAACREMGSSATLLVRGEQSNALSRTLEKAVSLGAEIFFVDRDDYRAKKIPSFLHSHEYYCIPEGGKGEAGVKGAAGITACCHYTDYTHIICAAGTGTTAAGLLRNTSAFQQLLVIPVLKGLNELEEEIIVMAGSDPAPMKIFHEYHFGGYARASAQLFSFMNEFFDQTGIPTDFVYTGKLFYAALDLLDKNYFTPGSRLLLIHTGGVQGNESLGKGTLIF